MASLFLIGISLARLTFYCWHDRFLFKLLVKGSDLYTTIFFHTQQFMLYRFVKYNFIMHQLLCMWKNCCVRINSH